MSADVGPRCARAIKVLPCVAGAPGRGHEGPDPRSGSCRVAQDPSQDPPRALDRARSCHAAPDRATKPGSSPVAHASRDEARNAGPISRSDPCQVVPGCATSCPRVTKPIAHSIAHSPSAKSRSRANGHFSRECEGVRNGSCRTRTVTRWLCQVVPRCARSCPCVPRGASYGASADPRLCQVVPGRARM